LPTDPLRLVAIEVDLGAGTFRGAIAQAHKRFAALAAGDDVMLVEVVKVGLGTGFWHGKDTWAVEDRPKICSMRAGTEARQENLDVAKEL
jgi:hypothetical protein